MDRRVSMLLLAAVAGVACGRSEQRLGPLGPDSRAVPLVVLQSGAESVSDASRLPGFRLHPAPHHEGKVDLAVGGHLTVNAASLMGIVAPGSRLRVDWGDGSQGGAACGSCRAEHVYDIAGQYAVTAMLGDPTGGDASARSGSWTVTVEGEKVTTIRIVDISIDHNPPPPYDGLIQVSFRIESNSPHPVRWWATLFDGPNAVGGWSTEPGGYSAAFGVGRFQADPLRVTLTALDGHGLEAKPVVLSIPWN